jgi:exosome complex RNA-binding protein Rrp4
MPDGTVILRGAMNAGTLADGTVVFNLPSSVFRPDSDQILLVNALGAGAQSRIRVQTNGNVDIFGCAGATAIRLSGIRFPLF